MNSAPVLVLDPADADDTIVGRVLRAVARAGGEPRRVTDAERIGTDPVVPEPLVARGDHAVRVVTSAWWALLPVSVLTGTLMGVTITTLLLARPLREVRRLLPVDLAGRLPTSDGAVPVAPLPLRRR